MSQVRFATIGLSKELSDAIAEKMAGKGSRVLNRADLAVSKAELKYSAVGLTFLGVGRDFETAMSMVGRYAEVGDVVVVASGLSVEQLKNAMRVGAREVVDPEGGLDGLPELLAKLAETHAGEVEYGQVIAVHGCAGGVGCSFIAISLARLIAGDRDRSVVLVDLSPAGGDLADTLDIKRYPNTHQVVNEIDAYDGEKAKAAFHREPIGYWVLPAPTEDDAEAPLDGDQAIALIALLASHFTDVIVDTGSILGSSQREILHVADRVVLVSTQSVTSVRSLVRRRQTLRKLDVPRAQTSVVVNLYEPRVTPNQEQLSEQLGVSTVATVSADPTLMHTAGMEGNTVMTVAPRSKIAREVAVVKARLLGEEAPEVERRWLKLPW